MKRLYFFAVLLLLYYECKAQTQPVLEHVKVVNKAVLIENPSLSDSLQTFTSSLYANMIEDLENYKDAFKVTQFSFCAKISSTGTVDTVLISDNVDYRLRMHISKVQNKLNYSDLIKQVKLKKRHDINLIFPFTILYYVNNSQNFNQQQEHLKKAFSFAFANLSTASGLVMQPTILFFSIDY
jgi:hypothetical protein